MSSDLDATWAAHRPALLRHCYRMLGSFADAEDAVQIALERAWKARDGYHGRAPVERWLYAIATNACLDALAHRQRRALPQLERGPGSESELQETEAERWITPAPDARLFPDPAAHAEARETVALAFVALLQRLPPRQRAALLLKDVLGWSADEVAAALDLTVPSVNSALHRGREAIAQERPAADEPTGETLQAFVRAWETRDLDALVALLRADVELAMPPHAVWFRGVETIVPFFRSPRFQRFWSAVSRVASSRANGQPALGFFLRDAAPHSIMVVRFEHDQVASMTTFIGAHHLAGFEIS